MDWKKESIKSRNKLRRAEVEVRELKSERDDLKKQVEALTPKEPPNER